MHLKPARFAPAARITPGIADPQPADWAPQKKNGSPDMPGSLPRADLTLIF